MSASGKSLLSGMGKVRTAPQGACLHNRATTTGDTKHRRAVQSSDFQQPTQTHFSRPATPEHPEQQLSTTGPSSKTSSAAALGVPGLQQAVLVLGDAAAHASRSEGESKQAGAAQENSSIVPDKAAGIQKASQHGRHQDASQGPLAVSWQVDIDRSRKPARAKLAQTGGQSPTSACPTLPKQPGSNGDGDSSRSRSPGGLTDVKHDGSSPANTGHVRTDHAVVQSALLPSQRPKARPLPPLPDFMSLQTFGSPSYSQDLPRMQALYAATDLASAFPDKPLQPAEAPHSKDTQATGASCAGMPSPAPGGAAPRAPEMIQHGQGGSLGGAHAALENKEHKTHVSKQQDSGTQLTLTALGCPDGLQQTLGAPLHAALHEAGATSAPGSAATGICHPQHCSTGAMPDGGKHNACASDRPMLLRMRAPHGAAGSAHSRAAGAQSELSEPGTRKPDHEAELSGDTAASGDEYASIKASLRCLQELLNKPQSPDLANRHTEDSGVGSFSDRHGCQHGRGRDAAATAPSEEQSERQPITDVRPTIIVKPKLSQDAHGAARSISQQETQLNGCMTGDLHVESAGLPEAVQASADDSDSRMPNHHARQVTVPCMQHTQSLCLHMQTSYWLLSSAAG